ncbi:unnamed protein product, partial [Prorocentrum cordatum]
ARQEPHPHRHRRAVAQGPEGRAGLRGDAGRAAGLLRLHELDAGGDRAHREASAEGRLAAAVFRRGQGRLSRLRGAGAAVGRGQRRCPVGGPVRGRLQHGWGGPGRGPGCRGPGLPVRWRSCGPGRALRGAPGPPHAQAGRQERGPTREGRRRHRPPRHRQGEAGRGGGHRGRRGGGRRGGQRRGGRGGGQRRQRGQRRGPRVRGRGGVPGGDARAGAAAGHAHGQWRPEATQRPHRRAPRGGAHMEAARHPGEPAGHSRRRLRWPQPRRAAGVEDPADADERRLPGRDVPQGKGARRQEDRGHHAPREQDEDKAGPAAEHPAEEGSPEIPHHYGRHVWRPLSVLAGLRSWPVSAASFDVHILS